jgi:hypothetical protein
VGTVAEDLEFIEKAIRQLQIEWEKFFSGIEKKPPVDLRTRLERVIREYSGGEIRNNTERFRYNTLTARYNTFNELWNKRLRALEEGRPVGLHGRAAAAAAEAMAQHAVQAMAQHALANPLPVARKTGGEFRVASPEKDTAAMQALYSQFVEARKQVGETGAVKFDSFQKLIAQQAGRILNDKGAKAVDFRLETKDGKVSLKAKPVR